MIESLPADLQHFIQAQVSAGNYSSEIEAVTQAVKLLRDQDESDKQFRAEVRRRVKSVDDGNYIELRGDAELASFFEQIKQEVRKKHGSANDST